MGDRDYFKNRAQIERAAAQVAADPTAFHAHMALAREYEWRAATEPYSESAPRSAAEPGLSPA